jgi:hypothetical protein
MKSILMTLAAGLLLAAGGCKQTGGDPGPTNAVSPGVVAELAARTLSGSSTQGLAVQVENLSVFSGGGGAHKPQADVQPHDTTIVRDKADGGITYHYVITHRVNVSDFGNSAAAHATVAGIFDSPRVTSTDSSSGDLVLTHVVDAESLISVMGTWHRTGTTEVKLGEPIVYTSTTDATINLGVSKSNHKIAVGIGTLTVTGTVSGGGSFSYLVNVVFRGNGVAELTINGSLYYVDLTTGTLVARVGG